MHLTRVKDLVELLQMQGKTFQTTLCVQLLNDFKV